MLLKTLVIGVGGFIGANARYWVGQWLGSDGFPWGTLAVNLIGCFGLAFFATYIIEQHDISDEARLLIATGFFGSLTTFSTYNFEALDLFLAGEFGKAFFYMATSVGVGLMAGIVGISLAR